MEAGIRLPMMPASAVTTVAGSVADGASISPPTVLSRTQLRREQRRAYVRSLRWKLGSPGVSCVVAAREQCTPPSTPCRSPSVYWTATAASTPEKFPSSCTHLGLRSGKSTLAASEVVLVRHAIELCQLRASIHHLQDDVAAQLADHTVETCRHHVDVDVQLSCLADDVSRLRADFPMYDSSGYDENNKCDVFYTISVADAGCQTDIGVPQPVSVVDGEDVLDDDPVCSSGPHVDGGLGPVDAPPRVHGLACGVVARNRLWRHSFLISPSQRTTSVFLHDGFFEREGRHGGNFNFSCFVEYEDCDVLMPLGVIVADHTRDVVLSALPEQVRALAWRDVSWAAASSTERPAKSAPRVDLDLSRSLAELGLDQAPLYLHISANPSKRSVKKLLDQTGCCTTFGSIRKKVAKRDARPG